MIKDFEEYKVYRSNRLNEDISFAELNKLTKAMKDFEKANPEIFDKLAQGKWSCEGMNICDSDGSNCKPLK
jgi:hypothetical protein